MAAKAEDEPQHINLKVFGQDSTVVQFKIKKTTLMSKLMHSYCERTGLVLESLRFRCDGCAITLNDTPTTLGLNDGDTIDVYQEQIGGYSFYYNY